MAFEEDSDQGFRNGFASILSPAVFILIIALVLFALILMEEGAALYNYDHVNVTARVNVTNAYPEILSLTVDPNANGVLNAGRTRTVSCNASIRDYNGFNDINGVNATFYFYLNQSGQQDDRNEHYTNTSCAQIANDGQYRANYTCTFPVQYFANNGTWHCNVTVIDQYGFVDSENRTTSIDQLLALNVTDVIDYGNLSITEYSANISAIVTNFGNSPINVSVLGYGQTEGDGLGFVCLQGTNISVQYQRFYNALVNWNVKTPLSALNQDMNITLPQQRNDAVPVTQNTYWQLYVPPNPFGVCTGTVRFTATAPEFIV